MTINEWLSMRRYYQAPLGEQAVQYNGHNDLCMCGPSTLSLAFFNTTGTQTLQLPPQL